MKNENNPNQMIRSIKDQEIIYLRKTVLQLTKPIIDHPEETSLSIRLNQSLKRLEDLLIREQ
ncbi:hypothetical protein [Aestuariivivens sp. NBU2969]|uniref:hypothetical protein n=1 Tax=Aestuariivivens sp. NBU2969 TaxID=2873267 RepID=UPI001CBE7D3D|nr:hypothetical protein [Aestuariivivens sp. NBU2969]